jgi:hypothetical protein
LTDRGFQTLAEAAPGHGLLYVADAVGGRSQTVHRIAIERRAHPRAVPTTALAVVTELFRDWAMPLAGPARDVIYWYFNELPMHTDQVGLPRRRSPPLRPPGPTEMSGRLVRKLCIVTDTD